MLLYRLKRNKQVDDYIESLFGKPEYKKQFIDDKGQLLVPFKDVKLFRLEGYMLNET